MSIAYAMPPSPSDHIYAPAGWPGPALPSGVSIENLPITDPYCTNDACKAFREGFADDQRKTPLLKLLRYGSWTVWFYSFWILLFTAIYAYHQLHDRIKRARAVPGRPSLKDKIVALHRFWSYRRPDNRFTKKIGLRQNSYGVLALLAFATVYFVILPWPQPRYLRTRFRFGSPPLSVRCAMIISSLTPLTVALAGKVNIITWMTGLGYDKLNVFHRYVAYAIFCFSTIHTVPHLIAPVQDGGWSMLNKLYANDARELSGTPLYFATFGLAFFSVPWVRVRFYELFKYVHIFLAVAYIGLFWWHIYGEFMSPYYIYSTVASLVFSNLIRLFQRQRNLRSFSNLYGFPATITQLHGNVSRIVVQVPRSFKWKPGQHVFLRIPSLSWIGNHPFSITNIPSTETKGSTHEMLFIVRRHNGFTKGLLQPRIEGTAIGSGSEYALFNANLDNTKVSGVRSEPVMDEKPLITKAETCGPHIEAIHVANAVEMVEDEVDSPKSPISQSSFPRGDTLSLQEKHSEFSWPPQYKRTDTKIKVVSEQPSGIQSSLQNSGDRTSASTKRPSSFFSLPPADEVTEAKMLAIANKTGIQHSRRTIIDGPYGTHHRPLHKLYDTVLCVAGGCGITAILPHVLDLTQRLSKQRKDEVLATRTVHLVWIVREAEWVRWVEPELITAIRNMREHPSPNNVTFTVDIYVTRSSAFAESENSSDDESVPVSPTSPVSDLNHDKVFSNVGDLEKGVLSVPSRPRPVLRRLDGGKGLFEADFNFGFEEEEGSSTRGLNVAMHYCRPVMKDMLEGCVGGDRAIVKGCGPTSFSADLANNVAALQRRILNGEMRELALELETFGL